MRIAILVLLSIPAATLAIPSAHAALVISTNATKNMSCTKGQCTATAANAVMNVSVLENALSFADDTISTGSAAQDIVIDTAISWTSANTLTLNAQRSIAVHAAVSDAGSGGLALTLGSAGQLSFGANGHIGFWSTSDSFAVNGMTYMLVNSVGSLKSAFLGCLNCKVALAGNYDATPDGTYGFAPVNEITSPGVFEGLGNTISNLSINDPTAGDYVGLVGLLSGGTVENLRLVKANIRGTGDSSNPTYSYSVVGGVAGYNQGTLFGDSVRGKVSGSYAFVGGLIGGQFQGTIANSYSAATVNGTDAGDVGGLAGFQTNGTSIRNSHATGAVTGGDGMPVGGLVGSSFTTIQGSYATGAVSGGTGAYVGGLAGIGDGAIRRSYATGNASAGDNSEVGGLVGRQSANVSEAYATGEASGQQGASAGGLAGTSSGQIVNTYATGIATSSYSGNLGGLVGFNDGTVSTSYSTGPIDGDLGGTNGGFIGDDNAASGSLTHNYWDTTTSGITDPSQGAGAPANDPGIAPRTTNQLSSGLPNGFNSSIWGEKSTVNGGLPYLLAIPPG